MSDLSSEELDRLKAAFLAIISHELRTPLTEIIAAVGILDGDFLGPLNADQRHYLMMIQGSASKLNSLIQDLLSFAQLQASVKELMRVPTQLEAMAQEAIHLHRTEMDEKKILLITDFAPNLPPISLDRQKITRVISNLVSNAISFTPEGGRVMVRTRVLDGGQAIDVADTGVGIPKEKQAKIFDSFYQTNDPMTRSVGGLGIGLAYAKQIVVAHYGKIRVDSVLGKGSMFTVWLPTATGTSSNGHSHE